MQNMNEIVELQNRTNNELQSVRLILKCEYGEGTFSKYLENNKQLQNGFYGLEKFGEISTDQYPSEVAFYINLATSVYSNLEEKEKAIVQKNLQDLVDKYNETAPEDKKINFNAGPDLYEHMDNEKQIENQKEMEKFSGKYYPLIATEKLPEPESKDELPNRWNRFKDFLTKTPQGNLLSVVAAEIIAVGVSYGAGAVIDAISKDIGAVNAINNFMNPFAANSFGEGVLKGSSICVEMLLLAAVVCFYNFGKNKNQDSDLEVSPALGVGG